MSEAVGQCSSEIPTPLLIEKWLCCLQPVLVLAQHVHCRLQLMMAMVPVLLQALVQISVLVDVKMLILVERQLAAPFLPSPILMVVFALMTLREN